MEVFKNGSTNYMKAEKVFDRIGREYEAGATVTGTLRDSADAAITGATALAMAESGTGRNIIYYAEVPHTVTLPAGTEGTQLVVVTTTSGKVGRFTIPVSYTE